MTPARGLDVTYTEFLKDKSITDAPTGIKPGKVCSQLFGFQSDIVKWALRRGRAAIFADCGMGKTPMQLEWARQVPGRVMIAAPLAVGAQTVAEAGKFGVDGVEHCRDGSSKSKIVVTNYEMLHRFDPSEFTGIVLDESSILKSYTGKFRNYLIDEWGRLAFRLAATATPAPNDFMELGNHAEFIGAMSRVEMLSRFFVHDGGETQKWRLKGHAESEFWKWLCSWAVMIRKPSDLGYEDGEFQLPPMHLNQVVVQSQQASEGMLFALEAHTMAERRDARKASIGERVAAVADLVNSSVDPWLIWCDLNSESEALRRAIPGSVEVRGSDDAEKKESALRGFSDGSIPVLVTKPSIAGWGMNWQHCAHMSFTGLSDSYEQFYQALRRCWRFGQRREVNAYVVTSSLEGAVVANIQRKEDQASQMAREMVSHMKDISSAEIKGTSRTKTSYEANLCSHLPSFLL